MLKFLTDNGLTPVVLVGFVMTIVSSFLSARWGGAESRRQYRDTAETDRRSAAAEMIPLLIEFADECDRKKGSLSTYMSSGGREGKDETMGGTTLNPAIRNCAARLGSAVAERAIKLEVTKARAESFIAEASGYIDEMEINEQTLSFLALLALKARWLVDMAAKEAGLSRSHPQELMDRLLKESMKHSHEIESGDETKWF
jgi:hypothetical protein